MIGNYSMVVTVDGDGILSKTFLEIETAVKQGMIVTIFGDGGTSFTVSFVTGTSRGESTFVISTHAGNDYVAESLSGYPVLSA